ncbi:hypothetical protein J4N46_07490 [Capnocytophaga sp. Marseille-Q4570]|uniref:Hydrolase n=1 Tax=Capnocytophaga bilenii TaxID=2819369 RepID=A0ABS3PY48_9FLAO|nr:hypothetical protein [Capnocytophaga bilenii]MBO1884265.1 hypothetical protein [Capnocytophaga bilenii]
MNKYIFITLLCSTLTISCQQHQQSVEIANDTAKTIAKLTDSITSLTTQRDEALSFSLESNELSQLFFEELKINNPTQIVTNALMESNLQEKNPYIKAETNEKFLINKIRILNEKWVICEFTDGKVWGDLLLQYHIDGNQNPVFIPLDEVIHPK